jgi:hypothetical protein
LIGAVTRQMLFVVGGLGVMIGVSAVDYRLYGGIYQVLIVADLAGRLSGIGSRTATCRCSRWGY